MCRLQFKVELNIVYTKILLRFDSSWSYVNYIFNLIVGYVPCLQLSVLHSHSITNKANYFLCIRY